MKFFKNSFNLLSKQEQKQYLLDSQEMNVFYTLPLEEREAVLDRISGHWYRKKGSGSQS